MENESLTVLDKAMIEYIKTCRKKKFHKQTMDVLAIIAGSEEAYAVYGTTEKAFQALVEIAKKHDDEQKVIDEFTGSVNL